MTRYLISEYSHKLTDHQFRYLEVISSFYDDILKELRKPDDSVRKTISEHLLEDYDKLGKSMLSGIKLSFPPVTLKLTSSLSLSHSHTRLTPLFSINYSIRIFRHQ